MDVELPFAVYQVGGAVRDRLLGLPAGDRDWVVVGATPQAMRDAGFRSVGRDFPVFLHPHTHEEYALARSERKQGHGYHGFVFHAAPDVTLEQDLARRDLTINAMAEDAQGHVLDPYGGRRDLDARLLRHVSPAFVEDPVRLLRVARFAARFAPLGFRIADETLALMRAMVAQGEVDHLVPERVWAELRRGLGEAQPAAMLRALRACGALQKLLPEVDALYGVPQRAEYHPEVDTGVHLELVLDAAARLAPGNDVVAFAALTHDLGKALTPPAQWPRHVGHERLGLSAVTRVCERLKVGNEHRALALAVCRHHLTAQRALQLRPATLLRLLEALDALRRPQRLDDFVLACAADAQGRGGDPPRDDAAGRHLSAALAAVRAVDTAPLRARGLEGPALGAALRAARCQALAALVQR